MFVKQISVYLENAKGSLRELAELLGKNDINLLALSIADTTGYAIKSTPNSAGGYKDWCIQKLKIPALTIEVGKDSLSHPIKEEYLDEIYCENKGVISASVQYLTELLCKKSL